MNKIFMDEKTLLNFKNLQIDTNKVYCLITDCKKIVDNITYDILKSEYFLINDDISSKKEKEGFAIQLTGENMGNKFPYKKHFVKKIVEDKKEKSYILEVETLEKGIAKMYSTTSYDKKINSILNENFYPQNTIQTVDELNKDCDNFNRELEEYCIDEKRFDNKEQQL